MSPILVLDYAGPEPATSRSFLESCWNVAKLVLTLVIFFVVVAVRGTLLLSGFACLFAGTLLLTLGGKRSAARKLMQWRERAADLTRLWVGDMLRPIRQWRENRRAAGNVVPGVVTSS